MLDGSTSWMSEPLRVMAGVYVYGGGGTVLGVSSNRRKSSATGEATMIATEDSNRRVV